MLVCFPVFCLHYDFELRTWNYGKGCTADEHVFCRYAAKGTGWIYGNFSDGFFAARCSQYDSERNKDDGEVNCRRNVLAKNIITE